MKKDQETFDVPSHVTSHGGIVEAEGPGKMSVALTPQAALETGHRLVEAAVEAQVKKGGANRVAPCSTCAHDRRSSIGSISMSTTPQEYEAKAAEALVQLADAKNDAERTRLKRAHGAYLKLATHGAEAAERAAARPLPRIKPEKAQAAPPSTPRYFG